VYRSWRSPPLDSASFSSVVVRRTSFVDVRSHVFFSPPRLAFDCVDSFPPPKKNGPHPFLRGRASQNHKRSFPFLRDRGQPFFFPSFPCGAFSRFFPAHSTECQARPLLFFFSDREKAPPFSPSGALPPDLACALEALIWPSFFLRPCG